MADRLVDAPHPGAGPGTARPRVVCLVPSLTELLCDLMPDNPPVGRTGFCVHPRAVVRGIPKVGGTKDVDIDKVAALAPTHVVVNVDENRRETYEALRARVPKVLVTHPLRPDDNLSLYRRFGEELGCLGRALELERDYLQAREALARAMRGRPRLRVLYLIWKKPWMSVSRATYISAALAMARLDTVPARARSRYPEIAPEARAWSRAQAILLSTEPYAFRARDARELAAGLDEPRPVLLVDARMTSWYGSRAIEGLRYLARFRDELDRAVEAHG